MLDKLPKLSIPTRQKKEEQKQKQNNNKQNKTNRALKTRNYRIAKSKYFRPKYAENFYLR